MANETVPMDFEALYGAERSGELLVPWDIGGPQPVVQQLVAYGALRGETLDPGTGPGYHPSVMRRMVIRPRESMAHRPRST